MLASVAAAIALCGGLFLWVNEGNTNFEGVAAVPEAGGNSAVESVLAPKTEHVARNSIETAKLTSIDFDDPEYAKTIRRKYSNTEDLPNGISFSVTMYLLQSMNTEEPIFARDLIVQEMGLGFSDAEDFRDRLFKAQDAFLEEVTRKRRELLCAGDVPSVYGDDVFVAFEEVDDFQDALAEEKFHLFSSQLPPEQVNKFHEWIDTRKLNTVSVRFKYKEHYELSGGSADANAAKICINVSNKE